MYNILPFIKWLMKQWFGGTGRLYQKYEQQVIQEPWFGLFLTIMLYTVFWVLATFLLLLFIDNAVQVMYSVWIGMAVAMFGNYVRIVIANQYRKFCQEQQQMIDRLRQP